MFRALVKDLPPRACLVGKQVDKWSPCHFFVAHSLYTHKFIFKILPVPFCVTDSIVIKL